MAKAKEMCKKITIVVRGKAESDLEEAFDEACRQVKEGYYRGHNSNDTGAYYFETSEDVEKEALPA